MLVFVRVKYLLEYLMRLNDACFIEMQVQVLNQDFQQFKFCLSVHY